MTEAATALRAQKKHERAREVAELQRSRERQWSQQAEESKRRIQILKAEIERRREEHPQRLRFSVNSGPRGEALGLLALHSAGQSLDTLRNGIEITPSDREALYSCGLFDSTIDALADFRLKVLREFDRLVASAEFSEIIHEFNRRRARICEINKLNQLAMHAYQAEHWKKEKARRSQEDEFDDEDYSIRSNGDVASEAAAV